MKGLASRRLRASFGKDNVHLILYNDQPQLRLFTNTYQSELLNYSPTIQDLIEETPYHMLPDISSLPLFLSFKKHPDMCVNTASDNIFSPEENEMDGADLGESLQSILELQHLKH